ncbi:MAG: oxygen-independent coproporphyrinogen oxidase [Firmicutes bacterium]|nr:oxygen-independent coproporphyrinogen oxidase [Bacillota bacterium]
MKLGVYIHIPFCRRKCLYCDFPSSAEDDPFIYESYITALCREIAGRGGILSDCTVDSVYIGGGTPTILSGEQLTTLVNCLKHYCHIERDAEFTVEANPDTVSSDKLAVLRFLGVNRLSIGVQSFDDGVLKAAGRVHSAAAAVEAVTVAKSCGFDHISIDLMYGLPMQSQDSFQADLIAAAKLSIGHISVYGLKVEAGTPFAAMLASENLVLPVEDEEDAMYQMATTFFPEQGYRRYEISNYACPGCECRHNLKYWRYQPYLGLGAAAHSFWQGERFSNTSDYREYIRLLEQRKLPVVQREVPDAMTAMAEYAFLALRTAEGLDYGAFKERFGVDFTARYGAVIAEMTAKGALATENGRIYLTATGMKYGNLVFAAFLPD